jgi:nicotinate-nucleotide adenylyltransferase
VKAQCRRVGIFRGTFDPVHEGHISFARKAITEAHLDCVYFLVEQSPRHKNKVSEQGHRIAMVAEAVHPCLGLDLLELGDINGGVGQIIPQLRSKFSSTTFVFLMGSDVAKTLPQWPDLAVLCAGNEIVIALRDLDEKTEIAKIIEAMPVKPAYATVINAPMPDASSSAVRKDISKNQTSQHVDGKVNEFIKAQRLYGISLLPETIVPL